MISFDVKCLIFFTGGIAENFELVQMEEEEVFEVLMKAQKKESFLTASTPASNPDDDEYEGKHI